ncbi:acyl-CoA thioesterase [Alicyclobacillus acidocaldarius]|nr:thioesterase family protein [Alicyclobacillus acidocaldarius]
MRMRVQWGETDAAGIVFYPNYFRWFDTATHEYFRMIGLSIRELQKKGVITPILSASCEFENPLYYDDEIVITSEITEVRNKTIRIDHTVRRAGIVTGRGHEWRGWVVEQGGKLQAIPIPDDVLERLRSARVS